MPPEPARDAGDAIQGAAESPEPEPVALSEAPQIPPQAPPPWATFVAPQPPPPVAPLDASGPMSAPQPVAPPPQWAMPPAAPPEPQPIAPPPPWAMPPSVPSPAQVPPPPPWATPQAGSPAFVAGPSSAPPIRPAYPAGQPASYPGAPMPAQPGAPVPTRAGGKISPRILAVGAIALVVIVAAVVYMNMNAKSGSISLTPSSFSCSSSAQVMAVMRLPSSLQATDQLTYQTDGVTESTDTVDNTFSRQGDGTWLFSRSTNASSLCSGSSSGATVGTHTLRILDASGKILAEGSYTLTP